IYGDYDVDGITAVALMLRVFQELLGFKPLYYIPERLREGYGLSINGINHAHESQVSLLISVDCGITAHEEISLANQHGIDVIITDHHVPGAKLPEAYAIIDPKRQDETYPFKELAGVGVAYKLLQGVMMRLGKSDDILRKYIELIAIGSAADIVPLVDENRIFVKTGLEKLMATQILGLQALFETSRLCSKSLGTGQIVFIIAPRINAVGRLGDAARALELLTTADKTEALQIAKILETENHQRKEIDEKTFDEALKLIESISSDVEQEPAFVLSTEGWHSGVIGIVASRVVEKYYRPTILISVENGVGKGSARSIPGFDLYDALKECDELMLGFGGHKYAAGLTIKSENIETFRKRFMEVTRQKMDEDTLIPKLRIDSEIRLSQIDAKFMRIIKQLGPFGPQNMRPVFMARNLEVVGTPSIVGKNHLRFKVRQDSLVMDAIAFNLAHLKYRLEPGEKNLNMAFVIEENEYSGRVTIQLRVKDMI
ncbi:single-stranded-DNA-specific exonuclease RecJ, partial [candidate division KSB1 bacterium]|nr:single-stranded-DNA-specific exonuclease RecJ [candidate division KSB1 bacterium]